MDNKEKIIVNMFGQFSISFFNSDGIVKTIDDKIIPSVKMWSMLSYLIVNRNRLITSEEVIDAIWNNKEISDPSNTIKTLLFKIRKAFIAIGITNPKKIITFSQGTFIWDKSITIITDIDEFEQLYNKSMNKNEVLCTKDLYRAIEIFKGDFMPQSISQLWAQSLNLFYHSKFLKLSTKIISEIIKNDNNYEQAIALCEKAISIEPYDEMLNKLLIVSFLNSGDVWSAKNHYQYFEKICFDFLGAVPTKLITDLYPIIQKALQPEFKNTAEIKKNLEEKLPCGAFYCEYAVFKEIYRVMARSRDTQNNLHLGIVEITNYDQLKKCINILNTNVENLIKYFSISLRIGDVLTRATKDKLLILISNIDENNFQKVIKRLIVNYKKVYPYSKVKLSFENADETIAST